MKRGYGKGLRLAVSRRAARTVLGDRAWISCAWFLSALTLVLALPAGAVGAQERGNLLTSGVTGSVPADLPQSRIPAYVLGLERVQRLMLDIAEAPRDANYIASALEGTGVTVSDLVAMGLVRGKGDAYVIDFAFFTAADMRVLGEVSERYGRSLAEEYLKRRGRFEEIFGRYPVTGVEPTAVAFLVLGCFSLDWDGLRLTQQLGYRGIETERMGDRGYLPYAQEVSSGLSVRGYYWGGHTEYLSAGALTSFGDHFLPRTSFPDLAWRMYEQLRSLQLADTVRQPLLRWAYRDMSLLMSDVVAVMMPLRSGAKSADELRQLSGLDSTDFDQLLEVLEALEYVRRDENRYATAIPVLGQEDVPMVQEAVALSRQVMTDWLAENYEPIRRDLGELTPLKYGVPYKEAFTQIWHYVFGATNRILAEEGMFFDPYGGTRRYQGFLPAVFHHAVRGMGRTGGPRETR